MPINPQLKQNEWSEVPGCMWPQASSFFIGQSQLSKRPVFHYQKLPKYHHSEKNGKKSESDRGWDWLHMFELWGHSYLRGAKTVHQKHVRFELTRPFFVLLKNHKYSDGDQCAVGSFLPAHLHYVLPMLSIVKKRTNAKVAHVNVFTISDTLHKLTFYVMNIQ